VRKRCFAFLVPGGVSADVEKAGERKYFVGRETTGEDFW
jgi:hypothetical protein